MCIVPSISEQEESLGAVVTGVGLNSFMQVGISFTGSPENSQHLLHFATGRELSVYEEVSSIVSSDCKVLFLEN